MNREFAVYAKDPDGSGTVELGSGLGAEEIGRWLGKNVEARLENPRRHEARRAYLVVGSEGLVAEVEVRLPEGRSA